MVYGTACPDYDLSRSRYSVPGVETLRAQCHQIPRALSLTFACPACRQTFPNAYAICEDNMLVTPDRYHGHGLVIFMSTPTCMYTVARIARSYVHASAPVFAPENRYPVSRAAWRAVLVYAVDHADSTAARAWGAPACRRPARLCTHRSRDIRSVGRTFLLE